ncbi:hypothetical protein JL722_3881 [Aureococcus anophagefferens]|nr:hypothetical protein JL722_3881 [Aureococcus anophagefferens]
MDMLLRGTFADLAASGRLPRRWLSFCMVYTASGPSRRERFPTLGFGKREPATQPGLLVPNPFSSRPSGGPSTPPRPRKPRPLTSAARRPRALPRRLRPGAKARLELLSLRGLDGEIDAGFTAVDGYETLQNGVEAKSHTSDPGTSSRAFIAARRKRMLDESVKILGHVEAALKLLESNDAATAAGTRKLLIKALRNLEREPANDKFRSLRTTNKTIDAKVVKVRGGVPLLQCAGFRAEGEFLVAKGDAAAVGAAAKAVADALEAGDGSYKKPRMSDGGVLAVGLVDGGPALSGARDGALMAFCRDGSAANRYVGHGEPLANEPKLTNAQIISSVCYDRASGLVLTGGWDRTVISWDIVGDAPAKRFGPFGAAVNGIAVVPARRADLLRGRRRRHARVPTVEAASGGDALGQRDGHEGHAAPRLLRRRRFRGHRVQRRARAALGPQDGARPRPAADGYLFAVCGTADALFAGGDDGFVTKFAAPSLAVLLRVPQPAAVWSPRSVRPARGFGRPRRRAALDGGPRGGLGRPRRGVDPRVVPRGGDGRRGLGPSPGARRPRQRRGRAQGGDVSMGGEAPPPPNPNFDFSFPVELAGRPGLQINWNRGDSADSVAIAFCDDNGIPRNQLGDVVVFVQNAMGSVEGGSGAAAPPPSQLSDAQKADMVNQVVNMGVDVEQAYAALEKTN